MGESYDAWKHEIEHMHLAVELWEAAFEYNGMGLEKYIQWTGDAFRIKDISGRSIMWLGWPFVSPVKEADVIDVAKTWLMKIITSHLTWSCTCRLPSTQPQTRYRAYRTYRRSVAAVGSSY